MDLKQYFRRLREIENSFVDSYPVLVSLDTPDGGKAGLISEMSRPVAAKMIVEGRAVPASEEQKTFYYQQQEVLKRAAEKAELAKRVQVAIIADPELQTHTMGKRSNP